jgi:signal transduction histidine kinase
MVLLAASAAFQFQRIIQSSQRERERMGVNLAAATSRFTQELDGEIWRAYASAVWAERGEDGGERGNSNSGVAIASWAASSPYRNLARHFYRFQQDELTYFDTGKVAFVPAAWSPALREIRHRVETEFVVGGPPLQASSGELFLIGPAMGRGPRPGGPGGPAERTGPGRRDEPGAPARDGRGTPPGMRQPFARRGPQPGDMGWNAIELNLEYIQGEMLPALVHKHFSAEYRVAVVVTGKPAQVIYADAGPVTAPDQEARFLISYQMGRPDGGRAFAPPTPSSTLPSSSTSAANRAPLAAPDRSGGLWTVRVQHAAGSLDAAASQMRWRDITLSGLIVLTLAASIFLLAANTRRAQALAAQQIEFVAGVSHELRTPLAVICAAGDNLSGGITTTPEQVRKYGALIRAEGQRLTETIEQVLRYAAMQAGGAGWRLEPVPVAPVIERAVSACAAEAEQNACVIAADLAPALPPIQADQAALGHAITNLLSNAIKYGPPGHRVAIAAAVEGDEVVIRVSDNGQGIAPEDLPHIFEPFYRGRGAAAGKIRGSGLGLHLVKRIVRTLNGTVVVESTLNHGSTFALRFPAAGTENS